MGRMHSGQADREWARLADSAIAGVTIVVSVALVCAMVLGVVTAWALIVR
jgi:hypothetical protein